MLDPNPDMSLMRVVRGVGYAVAGVGILIRTQRSARIHLLSTVCVTAAGVWLRLSVSDWCWLVLSMAMVWFSEAINTAIEFLSDVVCPSYSLDIKHVKDIAAAAVFFAVTGAIIIGVLVLGPPLWKLINPRI
jgi:diacylglycerol kinase (ATP)